MFPFLYLILPSLVIFRTCAFADDDLFSNPDDQLFSKLDDDFDASIFPMSESPTDIDETLNIDDQLVLSSCADGNQKPSKLRARENNGICSPNPNPPLTVPEFPNVMNSIFRTTIKYKNRGDVVGQIALKTPQEICALAVNLPESVIPVCGSPEFGRVSGIGYLGFYNAVYDSTLSKLGFLVLLHARYFRRALFCCLFRL